MRDSSCNKVVSIVTTSWDDGHPLDRRLADLLSSYGIAGTFYVAPKNREFPVMGGRDLLELRRQGMEIGSHTLTHAVLTQIPTQAIREELNASKAILEDALGESVSSFCYPKGQFNRKTEALIKESGFRLARTTVGFRTESSYNCLSMPVSLQLYPHGRTAHIRHALMGANIKGLTNWWTRWRGCTDVFTLSRAMFDEVESSGGIFHLWGHSWEIEQCNLWPLLEKILRYISCNRRILYLTNSQTADILY